MQAAISRAFNKHPIIGNALIYGALYSGAEFFQQTINKKVLISKEKPEEPYDTGTLARYAIMGTCVLPHTLYHVYKYLDTKYVGSSMPMVLRKLAIDAIILTPLNITLFYMGMSAMEGKPDWLEEWRAKIIPTFLTASVFWIPVNLLNFRYLPAKFRVIYVGAGQIIWVSMLCWIKRQDYQKKE